MNESKVCNFFFQITSPPIFLKAPSIESESGDTGWGKGPSPQEPEARVHQQDHVHQLCHLLYGHYFLIFTQKPPFPWLRNTQILKDSDLPTILLQIRPYLDLPYCCQWLLKACFLQK